MTKAKAKSSATKSAPKRPRGRPALYTEEVAAHILEALSHGQTLRSICSKPGMPKFSTVSMWAINDEPPGFAERYARARRAQADALAEEALDLSDNCKDAIKARLQVDTRKWFCSKISPAKFGDRQQVEIVNPHDIARAAHEFQRSLSGAAGLVPQAPAGT